MQIQSSHNQCPVFHFSRRTVAPWIMPLIVLFACENPATLSAGEIHRTRAVVVPPMDEITVIDPGVDPEGKPRPNIYVGDDNQKRIDIPPALIVHNYYYTGDRDFRGPLLPGGPSIVVVNHPETGERLYLDVQMLPGSPRVVYRQHTIDYHFNGQKIRIRFCNPLRVLNRTEPTVEYSKSCDRIREPLATDADREGHVSRWIHRTGLPNVVHELADGTKGALDATADRIQDVGRVATRPVTLLFERTPLNGLIGGDAEERAVNARESLLSRAGQRSADAERFIPTNR